MLSYATASFELIKTPLPADVDAMYRAGCVFWADLVVRSCAWAQTGEIYGATHSLPVVPVLLSWPADPITPEVTQDAQESPTRWSSGTTDQQ